MEKKEVCSLCKKTINAPEEGVRTYTLRECPHCSGKPFDKILQDYAYTLCYKCYVYEDMSDEEFEEIYEMTKQEYKESTILLGRRPLK